MSKKIMPSDFFEECSKVHNGKYKYHDDYVSMKTKIRITCPIHGDFYQEPRHHIKGIGCPLCSHRSIKYTDDEFKQRAIEVHGDKYKYVEEYKGRNVKIAIECPVHGVFYQAPFSHINGCGCPKCADVERSKSKRLGWNNFVNQANIVHNFRYGYYEDYDYVNNNTKVPIICKIHGVFWQTPNKHLNGCGCQKCSISKLEKKVDDFLSINGINSIYEYHLPINKKQSIDFYLSEYNAAIECQGLQHFKSIEHFGGEQEFLRRCELDKNKYKLCIENGIKLFYYNDDDNYNEFLGEKVYHNLDELLTEIKKNKN